MNIPLAQRRALTHAFFFLLVLLLGIGIRLTLILHNPDIPSDEAVYGLMAKHVAEKGEFPAYFWGRPSAGSLIAYIGAPLFFLFGSSGIVFKVGIFIFFFLPSMVCMYLLGKEIFKDQVSALLSLLFFALPPVFVSSLSIIPVGLYAEMLFFAPLIILLAYRTISHPSHWLLACSAFLWGLSLWTGFLLFPFVVFSLVVMSKNGLFSQKSRIIVALLFFIAGFSPALLYTFFHPGESFIVLAGRIIDLNRSVLAEDNFGSILFLQAVKRFFFWIKTVSVSPIALSPLMGISNEYPTVLLWFISLVYAIGFLVVWLHRKNSRVLRDLFLLSVGSFIFYTLPGMGRNRHFLALYIVIVIFLVFLLNTLKKHSKPAAYLTACAILCFNCAGTFAELKKKTVSFEPLITFLSTQRLFYGYSDYQVAYALTFAAKENIIVSPTLLHPTFYEQYPPYTKKVNAQGNVFYILNSVALGNETLNFEKILRDKKINFLKTSVGPFCVYYSFSERIYPSQLNYLQKPPR